ncbi:MAG: GIY-YIG nuclease family protein [Alphaproteobacteria bacterium]|nr:GIY-YIG nuclease family protein [Alphaproteobacteria bacterium]
MADPFTIRIFVVDGDPEGIRLVDRLNWTGIGLVFPREKWPNARHRQELLRTGVYLLVGPTEGDEDLPTLYIGEGDSVRDRIEAHYQNKDFWTQGFAFVTSNNGLNKAHVRWLEHALIHQAKKAARSHLDNDTTPNEPPLSEAERSDSRAFLREIVQALPIMGLHAFEKPTPVATPLASVLGATAVAPVNSSSQQDIVVVVPAHEDGFKQVFLGENRWSAIRISGGKLHQIRYIAAYQTKPVQAITHYAPVATIQPYGETGKYELIFSQPAKEIGPIPLADAPPAFMQGTHYTTLGKLLAAKKLMDLF